MLSPLGNQIDVWKLFCCNKVNYKSVCVQQVLTFLEISRKEFIGRNSLYNVGIDILGESITIT